MDQKIAGFMKERKGELTEEQIDEVKKILVELDGWPSDAAEKKVGPMLKRLKNCHVSVAHAVIALMPVTIIDRFVDYGQEEFRDVLHKVMKTFAVGQSI